MLLERTSVPQGLHARVVGVHHRSFRAWSGTSLSKYFENSKQPEPHEPDSSYFDRPMGPCSEEEMARRREQLQELLERIEAERGNKKKTG